MEEGRLFDMRGVVFFVFVFVLFQLFRGCSKCFIIMLLGLLVSLPDLVFESERGSFALL